MSLGYYGGFPGPPDNNEESNAANFRSNLDPTANSFEREVSFYRNDSDLSYQGPRFNSQPHPYFYNQPYFNQAYQQPYLQQGNASYSGINQGAAPFYPSNHPHNQQEQNENNSSGKSRRFSRQRTTNNPSSSGAKVGGKVREEEKPSHMSEQQNSPIRFSHQRETSSKRVHQEKKKSKSQNFSKPRKNESGKVPEGESQQLSTKVQELDLKEGKPSKQKKKATKPLKHDGNQASLLLEQLTAGTYECMVCCDAIKQSHAVWNCQTCYNLFHMGCIKKWARSSQMEDPTSGWRCPGCQTLTLRVPTSYLCFCGGERDPRWRKGELPHSCGEVCRKRRKEDKDCVHPCNILCHPGPCPQCPAMINKKCLCRKTSSRVRCGQQRALMCGQPCQKSLNCDVHFCEEVCHQGACESCIVPVEQNCFCGLNVRTIICGSDDHKASTHSGHNSYSCGGKCGKLLDCGNHECEQHCHLGECASCPLLPRVVRGCPCGRTRLDEIYASGRAVKREKCTDPIPTCDKICGKKLGCGGDENHYCALPCHLGACTPCEDGESVLTCRCGKSDKDVPCLEFVGMESYICDRRCNKKRKCGRHKCGQTCCVDSVHSCTQTCGKRLSCQLHRCEETCHRGACHTCYNVSFEELRCHCEDKVILPPVACGTRPPECARECTREHSCSHTVRHTCHTEENCPPCVELVKKSCNCGRQTRGSIMCHVGTVSCGSPCGKTLACGHKCLKTCHKGQCLSEGETCHQPCSIMRSQCIHPCSNPCHHGNTCPTTKCKAMVTLKCGCGLVERRGECGDGYHGNEAMMRNSMDVGKFLQASSLRALACTEECSVAARNRRLAEALDIKDPDIGGNAKHVYSEFLVETAKCDPAFIRMVEREVSALVESVQSMGIHKQVHSFPSMKRDKRQAIHELATAFSCKSDSHDSEPNRNVVVTATKGVASQPQPLLSEVTMRGGVRTNLEKKPKGRLLSSVRLVPFISSGNSPTGKLPTAPKPNPVRRSTQPGSAPPITASRSADFRPHSSLSPFAKDFEMRSGVTGVTPATVDQSRSFSQVRHLVTPSHEAMTSQLAATKKEEKEIDYFDMTG